ncbi:hypothetical protein [Phaeobacter sp. C3_T13_0]|uniref:hypothetical protein n=1 Tax=Phaeobacter cretensis TaxID=3342641 RepID=UPI0039BD6D67
MIAKLPGFGRPRILQFESALEYAFLCLMLIRDDIHHIWDQPPAIQFVGADGRPAKHVFDFLITLSSGKKIAIAIKPMNRVLSRNFMSELEHVTRSVPKQFADRVLLITDKQIDRRKAAVAARKLATLRPSLTGAAA